MVRTLHFHCRGHGFDPWLGNYDPASYVAQPKKKEKGKETMQLKSSREEDIYFLEWGEWSALFDTFWFNQSWA